MLHKTLVLLTTFVVLEASGSLPARAEDAPAPVRGEIVLDMQRYEELLEQIEAAAGIRATRARNAAPHLAEIVRSEASLRVDADGVHAETTFDVAAFGQRLSEVKLPAFGLVTAGRVEPAGAYLSDTEGEVSLVAVEPGTYRIHLTSFHAVPSWDGPVRLRLPAVPTPVSRHVVDLEANLAWACADASLVGDELQDGRRTIQLALAPGRDSVLELRPTRTELISDARVQTTTATRIAIDRHGAQRTDFALYEVASGELRQHTLRLPAALDPETVTTDESASPFERNGRELRIFRESLLRGTGSVTLRSTLGAGESLPLEPVLTDPVASHHYLLLQTTVAARAAPQPASAWVRIDPSDVPSSLARLVGDLNGDSVWRRKTAVADAASLRVDVLPEAPDLGAVVRRRETTTLATVDGSLVHRDRFTVVGRGSALEVELPQGAELWSLLVDDQAMRPLERDGKVYVPLSLGNEQARHIELISVLEQEIAATRSTLAIHLAQVATPVLDHRWRVLLPPGRKYRLAEASLRATDASDHQVALRVGGGTSAAFGTVRDHEGRPLPGVVVTLAGQGARFTSVTDASGWYAFAELPPGRYSVSGALEGFQDSFTTFRLSRGRSAQADLTLGLGLTEEITVTSEAPLVDHFRVQETFVEQKKKNEEAEFRVAAQALQVNRTAGVKPLPVDIPEDGKLLQLTGVLPPSQVSLALDVRAGR